VPSRRFILPEADAASALPLAQDLYSVATRLIAESDLAG
jgi:hypothetical protein